MNSEGQGERRNCKAESEYIGSHSEYRDIVVIDRKVGNKSTHNDLKVPAKIAVWFLWLSESDKT